MKDQFVTYEIAKKLKELGFNEDCFGCYKVEPFDPPYLHDSTRGQNSSFGKWVAAPLWQQAIDWLRVEYDKFILIRPVHEIHPEQKFLGYSDGFTEGKYHETYEQAREAATLKALELIKKD